MNMNCAVKTSNNWEIGVFFRFRGDVFVLFKLDKCGRYTKTYSKIMNQGDLQTWHQK